MTGNGTVEYQFGGKTLQGQAEDAVSVFAELKDDFGNQVVLLLASIKNPTGVEEATIWIKPNGLLFLKYDDGTTEYFI